MPPAVQAAAGVAASEVAGSGTAASEVGGSGTAASEVGGSDPAVSDVAGASTAVSGVLADRRTRNLLAALDLTLDYLPASAVDVREGVRGLVNDAVLAATALPAENFPPLAPDRLRDLL